MSGKDVINSPTIGRGRKCSDIPMYSTINIRVEDGKLIITTLLEEVDGIKKYTSARINPAPARLYRVV